MKKHICLASLKSHLLSSSTSSRAQCQTLSLLGALPLETGRAKAIQHFANLWPRQSSSLIYHGGASLLTPGTGAALSNTRLSCHYLAHKHVSTRIILPIMFVLIGDTSNPHAPNTTTASTDSFASASERERGETRETHPVNHPATKGV